MKSCALVTSPYAWWVPRSFKVDNARTIADAPFPEYHHWSVPPSEVDGIWVFRPLRNGPHEWGTAIVSRVDGERRRIYTARYQLAIKGKERGRFEAAVEEVGSGTVDALEKLVQEAARRTEEEEPPAPVERERWFPTESDGPPDA